MTDNRSLVEIAKADLATSDFTAAGVLAPAQAQRFIQTLIDRSTVLPMATVVPMRAQTQRIEKIRFGTRVLRAGNEAQALVAAERAKPDLAKEELNAQLFKAEVRLNNEVLEDSIERGNLRSTVMQILAQRISLDMDEVIVNGDTTSADTFLAKFDGIIKAASVNVHNAADAAFSKSIMREMLTLMPTEFLRNRRLLRFLASIDTEIEYHDTVAARETVLGDRFLEDDAPASYSGIPIIGVPVFPENLGPGTDETVCLLTDPKNVNVGIWRNIQMETDKDISAGVLVIVATLRFDVKYAEPKAVVKATDIKHL